MKQPLVHPQRLSSLIESSSWTLVKDEQNWLSIFSPLPLIGVLWIGLTHVGWSLWAGLGCVHPIFEPTKWIVTTHVAMSFHPSWTLIISKFLGFHGYL